MNKYYVKENGQWCHKTPLKLFLNPFLRKIQPWTNKPVVLGSITEFEDKKPNFIRYQFGRKLYIKRINVE